MPGSTGPTAGGLVAWGPGRPGDAGDRRHRPADGDARRAAMRPSVHHELPLAQLFDRLGEVSARPVSGRSTREAAGWRCLPAELAFAPAARPRPPPPLDTCAARTYGAFPRSAPPRSVYGPGCGRSPNVDLDVPWVDERGSPRRCWPVGRRGLLEPRRRPPPGPADRLRPSLRETLEELCAGPRSFSPNCFADPSLTAVLVELLATCRR